MAPMILYLLATVVISEAGLSTSRIWFEKLEACQYQLVIAHQKTVILQGLRIPAYIPVQCEPVSPESIRPVEITMEDFFGKGNQ